MMLNIKVSEIKKENAHYIFLGFAFATIFIFELFFLLRFELVPLIIPSKNYLTFLSDFVCISTSFSDFFVWHFTNHNALFLGLILFTEYFNLLIVSGFILLFSMIGTIVLTLHKKFVSKSQNIYAQVLRDYRLSINVNS
jgi:NADH:ubiquinone oxidoreductase subunit 6 (subunit J)